MLNKISEAQRSMLQAAAKREDRLLTPPLKARAAALVALAAKLLDAGWVKEIKARDGAPVWRKDATSGQTFALKLTPKSLKAVAAMVETTSRDEATSVSVTPGEAGQQAPAQRPASSRQTSAPAHEELCSEGAPTAIRAPRPNSKIGRVLDMLAAEAGATIGELIAATGWLEHTTRAALTGLRHRGYELSLTRKERDSASIYRIVARGEQAAP
jgi:Protein of unknown function (DUF3489)